MQENTIASSLLESWINLDITWKGLNTVYVWKIQYSCLTCQNVCQGFFIDISINSESLIMLKSVRIWTWHERICHFLYGIMKYMKKCLRMGSTTVDKAVMTVLEGISQRGLIVTVCGGHVYTMCTHTCKNMCTYMNTVAKDSQDVLWCHSLPILLGQNPSRNLELG